MQIVPVEHSSVEVDESVIAYATTKVHQAKAKKESSRTLFCSDVNTYLVIIDHVTERATIVPINDITEFTGSGGCVCGGDCLVGSTIEIGGGAICGGFALSVGKLEAKYISEGGSICGGSVTYSKELSYFSKGGAICGGTAYSNVIVVTIDAKTKQYGDADPTFTYTLSQPLDFPDTPTGSLSRDAGEDVGTYQINKGTLAFPSKYTIVWVYANLTITKATQTITNFSITPPFVHHTSPQDYWSGTYNDTGTMSATGGGSGNPITYFSAHPSIATVIGDTIYLGGTGNATITVTQAGDANYLAASKNILVSSNKLLATINAANATNTYTGSPIAFSATTTPPGLPVSFTYNGSITPPTNVGVYTVIGTINHPLYYGTGTWTLTIEGIDANLRWVSLPTLKVGQRAWLVATSDSGGVIEYRSINGTSTQASVTIGGVVTPLVAGVNNLDVEAIVVANGIYKSTTIQATLSIGKGVPIVVLPTLPPITYPATFASSMLAKAYKTNDVVPEEFLPSEGDMIYTIIDPLSNGDYVVDVPSTYVVPVCVGVPSGWIIKAEFIPYDTANYESGVDYSNLIVNKGTDLVTTLYVTGSILSSSDGTVGGSGIVTWTTTSGRRPSFTVPAGITITSADVIYGTTPGTYTIRATTLADNDWNSSYKDYTFTIPQATSTTPLRVLEYYNYDSRKAAIGGGTLPYTWSVYSNTSYNACCVQGRWRKLTTGPHVGNWEISYEPILGCPTSGQYPTISQWCGSGIKVTDAAGAAIYLPFHGTYALQNGFTNSNYPPSCTGSQCTGDNPPPGETGIYSISGTWYYDPFKNVPLSCDYDGYLNFSSDASLVVCNTYGTSNCIANGTCTSWNMLLNGQFSSVTGHFSVDQGYDGFNDCTITAISGYVNSTKTELYLSWANDPVVHIYSRFY